MKKSTIYNICGALLLLVTIGDAVIFPNCANAVAPGEVRFINEATDTTKITTLLIDAWNGGLNKKPDKIALIGEKLVGTPYLAGTLDSLPERLTVNMDGMDCTTFVETVVAMALTLDERRTSWHDFVFNLERLRYRNGAVNGYGSRLHYVSDWAIDNSHRGILQEVTDRAGNAAWEVKTLDFMTRNKDKYPALSDDEELEKIKNAEIGYRSHRFPYIKSRNVAAANLRGGDIVAITTKTPGLDVQHMGIVVMKEGVAHLMHASSKAGKVIVDPLPLSEYLRRNRSATGIRVFRLRE